MIPPEQHPNWTRLIKGELAHTFKYAAAGLLFFNLRSAYKKDPQTLPQQIAAARQFFQKYENVLADDTKAIFQR